MHRLTIPELSLVVLIGPSGSGKSSFARRHFKPTEVISSDFCRGLVSDDENDQSATGDAFDLLRYVAGKRLARGLLTVIDATNVQPESRQVLVEMAREHDVLPVAIVLDVPEQVCRERNRARPDREFGAHVIRNQIIQMRKSIRFLEREGFRYVHRLSCEATDAGRDVAIDDVEIERQPLWNNRKWDAGPFDIIGDVHGCYDELIELLNALGYETTEVGRVVPPAGRKAVFVGDLVDRGPKTPEVLRLVMSMVAGGVALCVPGNHDVKLLRKLRGKNVQLTHGLAETMQQLEQDAGLRESAAEFIDKLVGHYVLDGGKLVVAHAGMKQRYIGRASQRVREFALYGETTGESDEFGLPVRHNWAAEYRGPAAVVYGHTPVPQAEWLNGTINIDTGCVFGGKLTALRWPERELVSVPAKRVYAHPVRPFLPDQVPHFGSPVPGADYIDRPGAYGIVRDTDGRVAVVRCGEGHFLPGGGMDDGETPEAALVREGREECGQTVTVGREIGRAVQFCTTRSGRYFAKQCTYFEAAFIAGGECTPTEADHTLIWLEPEAALKQFTLEADAWAVRRVLGGVDVSNAALTSQQINDDVLDLEDVLGKRIVATRLMQNVTVREENATAALEVMSRFAANPKWLIYLPPTMSPTETTTEPGLLEHPREAFEYFRHQGVERVVIEEKHMGSRAVVVVCRDEAAATRRFGVRDDGDGIIYTRTGRRFFEDRAVERELLGHVRGAIDRADLWNEFESDWFCLDCELMPWSAKAQDLLKNQYAAVGSASRAALADTVVVLEEAAARYAALGHDSVSALAGEHRERLTMARQYVDAYRRYCWPVNSVADLKLAPFHLLASEGHVHIDKDHVWHMRTLATLAAADSPLMATAHQTIDINDPESVATGVAWWEELTGRGGEGMVIKPLEFIVRGKKGLVQPAVKCRGREYLRIIYGPEYTADANLTRLRGRGVSAKRSLALREFALGIEALERFVRREPLRRVHECVFGVLALESEPVDPRL